MERSIYLLSEIPKILNDELNIKISVSELLSYAENGFFQIYHPLPADSNSFSVGWNPKDIPIWAEVKLIFHESNKMYGDGPCYVWVEYIDEYFSGADTYIPIPAAFIREIQLSESLELKLSNINKVAAYRKEQFKVPFDGDVFVLAKRFRCRHPRYMFGEKKSILDEWEIDKKNDPEYSREGNEDREAIMEFMSGGFDVQGVARLYVSPQNLISSPGTVQELRVKQSNYSVLNADLSQLMIELNQKKTNDIKKDGVGSNNVRAGKETLSKVVGALSRILSEEVPDKYLRGPRVNSSRVAQEVLKHVIDDNGDSLLSEQAVQKAISEGLKLIDS